MNQVEVPTLCTACQGGRLVGQAVLGPDGEWHCFLACTDCDTKIELGPGSTLQLAQAATTDRTCSHPGCTTVLSSYNDAEACWAHTGPSFP